MKFNSEINIRATNVDGHNRITLQYSPDLTMAEVITVLHVAKTQTWGLMEDYVERNEIVDEKEQYIAYSELPIKHTPLIRS